MSARPAFALFEDRCAAAGEPAAWLLEDACEFLTATDGDELAALAARLETMPGWWALALDYELGAALEPALAERYSGRPLARCWRFSRCRRLDREALADWLSIQQAELSETERCAGIGGLRANFSASDYLTAVERIRRYIADGDCYQVNYTFAVDFTAFGHPLALYAALRERQPVRYGGILCTGDAAIVSLSPELFFERQGECLLTRPMKGTAPRVSDPEALRLSEKDRAENLMIVDLLRNDLGRIARTGSVRVDALFAIEDYPTLWQMVSQVSAAAPGVPFFDLLRALFPCGSVTGAPKIRAMQIVGELEAESRGLYTGAFGWLAPDGDCRLNVAIRTLELAGGQGRLGIGSGIVADSVAIDEWRECWLKAAFLSDFDPGLRLIETLRRENGVYPRLERHLARLRASAAWLDFACDEAAVHRALASIDGGDVQRVRLTLGKRGDIEVGAAMLAVDMPGPRYARLASCRIDADHPLQRHKTTARLLYDRALAEIAAAPEIFDTIFLNQRGEIAEGARSNVFVERDGFLLTPPLTSGALPGVLRDELLACGRAREAVLRTEDLQGDFWLGNALRGLIAVRLTD